MKLQLKLKIALKSIQIEIVRCEIQFGLQKVESKIKIDELRNEILDDSGINNFRRPMFASLERDDVGKERQVKIM